MGRGEQGEWEFLLFRQDGVLTRGQARAYLSESALRHRVSSGRWRRLHRTIYLTSDTEPTEDQQMWAAVLAVGEGAVLAGTTALRHRYRISQRWGHGIHVLVPSSRRDKDAPVGVVVHRTTVLPEEDVHAMAAPPCTMPARSLVDAAQWARTDEQATAVVAAGFQRRLVNLADIEAVLGRLSRAKRRAVILRAARDAEGGSHSLAEIDYLRLNRRFGLPEPTRQHRRKDASGRQRYLDAYYEEYRVHVEIDGGQHLDVRTAWADMKRQNDLWVSGDRVLRFPAHTLRHHPDQVFTQIRAALHAAGWRDLGPRRSP